MRVLTSLCFCIYSMSISLAILCPEDIIEWNKRSKSLNCSNDKVYHCALDQANKPIELCFERVIIPPDEDRCPWFAKQGGKVLRGSPYRECPENVTGCPPKNHTGYYFDMLYLYPACLTPFDKRKLELKTKGKMNLSEQQYVQHCKDSTEVQCMECTTCKNNDEVVVVVSITAGFMALLVVVLTLYICWKRRRKQMSTAYTHVAQMEMSPNEENTEPKVRFERPGSTREKGESFIIKRREMDELKSHLQRHQTAFIIGEWGCGKSTILEWYFKQDSMKGKKTVFDCTDTFTFYESLKSWQKSIPKAVKLKTESLDFTVPVRKSSNESISSLVTKLLTLITEEPNFESFILVLDKVGEECKEIVSHLIGDIKDLMKVKCIVTSDYSFPLENVQPISVGVFDENQAVTYLKSGCIGFPDEGNQKWREIATLLQNSPIALHCAKTYIRNSHISTQSALERFRNKLGQNYIKQIEISQKIPLIFVMEILKCAHPLVYDMLQCLQFVRPKDIPIILLQFLKLPTFKLRNIMPADNFVLVVDNFSFISITGFDLRRVINIHPGVLNVFKRSSDDETKKECIMTLLSCLSCLFSKRPGAPVTRERYIQLLPHAMETLIFAHALHKKNSEFFGYSDFLVLTVVFDRVIYTHSSMGLSRDAKALTSLFRDMTPFFGDPCDEDPNVCAEATLSSFQKYFDDNEKEKLQVIATEYILNKVRRKRNLSTLKRQDSTDNYEYQISEADYERLVEEGNAIDLKYAGLWLYFQVHISIALTIGMKKAEGSPDTPVKGNSLKYIRYATSLASMLKKRDEFKQINLYSVLDAEINGMVDLQLHSISTTKQSIDESIQRIQDSILSIKDNGYFVACVKTTDDADMCIYIGAMKQIIRLLLWKHDQTGEHLYIDQAGQTANELRKYIAERREFLRESFIAQTAKQCIVKCLIKQELFHKALNTLDELSPFDPLGDGDHILTKYDVIDIDLKCECYTRTEVDKLRETLGKVLGVKRRFLFHESEIMPLLKELYEKYERMLTCEGNKI